MRRKYKDGGNRVKLLLVEDDNEIRHMLKDYLNRENYDVACAADGAEACEKFESDTYSLVLLDLMIPKISGMDVIQHIRKKSTVPIIIVSAKDTDVDKTLAVGDLIMNLSEYTVTKRNKQIFLTAKEYEILKLLIQNPKKVYTKAQIYSLIWNDAYMGDENAVNVHISRLRNKIEDNPRTPKYVMTVWGIGYKLGYLS